MQLHVARLCLDCNEIHDTNECPRCGSESFAFLSRWVPAPERRVAARPTSSPEAEVYRELIEPRPTRRGRLGKGGALGLRRLAVAGWVLRKSDSNEKSSVSAGQQGGRSTTTRSNHP